MAGFEAAGIVEPLKFDFSPYVSASGTSPEPSDDQIVEWMQGLRTVFSKAKENLPDEVMTAAADNPMMMLAALDELKPEQLAIVFADMAEVYSKLCSGKPTTKQILGLPLRVRALFFQWLSQEVMSPEAVPAAGTQPATPQLRAVGGSSST